MPIAKFLIIFIGLLLFTGLVAGTDAAKVYNADSFFRDMAAVKTLSCSFVQEQRIAGLRNPIRLTGRFYMNDAGDLAWIVRTPVRFYCIIHNGKLSSWDMESDTRRVINLKEHPAFSTMINMMRDFFAGRISIEKDYQYSIVSARKIMLSPRKHSPLAENVKNIAISLSADRRSIENVKIDSCSGDSNTMYFSNTALNKLIPESVWLNGDI